MVADGFTSISEVPGDLPQQTLDSRCPPQKTTTFFWVNDQDSKGPSHISSRKQSFIKTRDHRLRKKTQLKRLKESLKPFPRSNPRINQKFQDVKGDKNENDRHLPVISRSMQAGLVEAFPSLPRYTNESVDYYFHYYKTYVSQIALPFSSNIMSIWFLRTALGQPALVETVLLMSAGCLASHLIMVDASNKRIRRTIQDTLQLRSRTLKSLQNLLSHPSTCFSEETLLIIALLMSVEGAQADFESVDAHIVGLQHVITRLGGLEKISLQTLSILYCCDAMQGLNRNSPPTFRISTRWITWIQNNSTCLNESLYPSPESLGNRFFNALWFGGLPEDLIKIIKVFGKLISIHERMVEIDSRNMPAENECYLLMMHQLYSLQYKMAPFEDVICMSIRVYSTNRVWGLQSRPTSEHLSRNLQQRILKCYDQLQRIAPDLLFWSLFLGGLISKGLEGYDWFLKNLKDSAEHIGVQDWAQAVAVLEGFFFVCRSRDEPARELWESVLRSRDRRNSKPLLLKQ